MAISFAGATGVQSGTNTSSVSVNALSGVNAGDLLICFVSTWSSVAITPPSGWAQYGSTITGGADYHLSAWYKVATASEPASYTFLFSAASLHGGAILAAYTGVDNSNPIDSSASSLPANALSMSEPSATTTADGCQLLSFFGGYQDNSAYLTSVASGETLEANSSGYSGGWLADVALGKAGSYGAGTWTLNTVTGGQNVFLLLALKPASTSGTTVSISASGASASSTSASSALARSVTGAAVSDSGVSLSVSVLRSVAASASSATASSGVAGARRAGVATLTSDSSVAGLVSLIRSAVASIASSTANAASTLARRAVGASSASVSTASASASVVGSAILGTAAVVSATAMSASALVRRGVSAVSDAVSGVLGNGALGRLAAALSASISVIQVVGQVAGSMLVASTTIAITLDMELSDTVVIETRLSDMVQLAMPLEEV